MKTGACLTFALLCCTALLAQFSAAQQWTDQNNLQMSAAYMLRTSYYERGHMGAKFR